MFLDICTIMHLQCMKLHFKLLNPYSDLNEPNFGAYTFSYRNLKAFLNTRGK